MGNFIKNNRGMMLVFAIIVSLVLSLLVLFIADTIRIFTVDANRTSVKVTLNVAIDNVKKYHSCCDIYALYFGGAVPFPLTAANFTLPATLTLVGQNNVQINNFTAPYQTQGYVDVGYTALRLRVQNTLSKELHQRSIANWVDLSNFTGMGNFDFCKFDAQDYRATSAYCTSGTTTSTGTGSVTTTGASSTSSSTTSSSSSSSSGVSGTSSTSSSSSSSSTGGTTPRQCPITSPQYCNCGPGFHCEYDQTCINFHGAFCTCPAPAPTCVPDDSCTPPIIVCGGMCVCNCDRTNYNSCSFNCCCTGMGMNWCYDTGGQTSTSTSSSTSTSTATSTSTGGEPPDYVGGCGEGMVRCFGAGTLINTPNGPQPIETLRVGDRVISYDIEKSMLVESQVTKNFRSDANKFMYIKFEGGVFPKVTPEHPFFSKTRNQWVEAKNLKPMEELMIMQNNTLKKSRVLFTDLYKDSETPVFNLEVDSTHNYFANNVLVHNKVCRILDYTCILATGCAIGFSCGDYNGIYWYQQIDNTITGCNSFPYPCPVMYSPC